MFFILFCVSCLCKAMIMIKIMATALRSHIIILNSIFLLYIGGVMSIEIEEWTT